MTFLLEVFDRAVHRDRRNQIEIDVAKSQLNTLLKRLDNMMADPKRHPLDRRAPGFIDLNIADPGPEVIAARKKATMDRVADSLNAYVEAALPKILAEVKGASPAKPAPVQENIPQGSVSPQPSKAPVQPVRANPAPVARDVSRAPLTRPVADRAPIQRPSEVKPAPAKLATGEPAPKPAPARPLEPAARPQKTRFRPEPFYKPKEQGGAPAAVQTKNPGAEPVKSPAPTPVNAAPKASALNSPKSEAATKPVAAGNSQQAKPTVNNVPKPEHAAPGTKPVRDHAGSAVSKSATTAPALLGPVGAQRPAAAPTNTNPVPTQSPPRPAQAPVASTTRPGGPQAGSAMEPVTAKATSASAPVPAQVPVPRPEPAQTALGPATGIRKSDAAKEASEAKAPARPERTSVAPKPSPAPTDPARIPGERSGENPAAKPAKEEPWIRVGEPISLGAFQPTEPIRVEGKKQPKKPKRRGRDRDDGPGL